MTFLRPCNSGFLLLLFLPVLSIDAQSPEQELWTAFLSRPPERTVIPEDEELGMLADLRNPAPAWASAIAVCEAVFQSLSEGQVPSENLALELGFLLNRDFESVLAAGNLKAGRRYGLPERSGDRMNIPVRLSSDNHIGTGHVYLVRIEGAWFVEQWALDLTPFIIAEELILPEE